MTTQSPAICHSCSAPATAGPDPLQPHLQRCITCASIDTLEIPPNPERKSPVPESVLNGPAWAVASEIAPDGQLWDHQARALELLTQDHHVVIATGTASGKTLIFQVWTMDLLATNPQATVLAFYPTKALANDQVHRWRQSCAALGLPPDTVGQIDGDVHPMERRNAIIGNSRIVIMTPDVCHAWLLRTAGAKNVRRFLKGLALAIVDEAHTYEGVMGSNSAYLFRRLVSATTNAGNLGIPQLIAATATILDPDGDLRRLTGQTFSTVNEEDNGAPRHSRTIHHLPTVPQAMSREEHLAQLVTSIIDADEKAQVIAFADSRQGVERIVQQINRPDTVMPYRSGYQPQERRNIEDRLRSNSIRAVIATSALELGIDMPDLDYGINLGLPPTRKQFHQRLGRVGRTQPGTFIVLADADQFTSYGETLKDYYGNSVEDSHLYLDNEFIKLHQALCLKSELEHSEQNTMVPPGYCEWPDGFEISLRYTHGHIPDHLSRPALRSPNHTPQIEHSLRSTGEEDIAIFPTDARNANSAPLGKITVSQAIKEAYPGAVYRHFGKSYRIEQWNRRREDQQPYMRATPLTQPGPRTDPVLRQTATVHAGHEETVRTRWKTGDRGYGAQTPVTITVSVEGYEERQGQRGPAGRRNIHYYHDLQNTDPRKTRKQHEFPTTGIIIRIDDPWFAGQAGTAWQARNQLAQALRTHLAYQRSINLADLGLSVDNIIIQTQRGYHASFSSILVFDNVYGGLGLVQHLYDHLPKYAQAIASSTPPGRNDDGSYSANAERFSQWTKEIREGRPTDLQEPGETDWWRVVRPQSPVTVFSSQQDKMTQGEVVRAEWDDGIVYVVDTEDGTLHARDSAVEAGGPEFDWLLWHPATGQHQQLSSD